MFFNRRIPVFFLFVCLLLSCTARSQTQETQNQPTQLVVIRAARMLDVSQGRIILDPVIIINGERIVSAGIQASVPTNAKVIDLGDVTLIPGLIDAHTHITYHFDENGMFGATGDPSPTVTLKYAEENARRTLEAGF